MSGRTGLMKPGTTFFSGAPQNATDQDGILGREIELKDSIRGWERVRVLRAVRNLAAFTVLPKRAVVLSADGRTITGYSSANSDWWYLVDEQLPAAGVVVNDICWVVIQGPSKGITYLANDPTGIALLDWINPVSAASSGATSAGRLQTRVIVAATADATAGQRNVTQNDGAKARAMSAVATNSTNNDVLVDLNPF